MPFRRILILLCLVAAPLVVYGRMVRQEFVIWDDPLHVTENPMLNPVTPASLALLWQRPYFSLYMPLTYTLWATEAVVSRAIDGDPHAPLRPSLFKATGLALHMLNVLLVFAVLRRLVPDDWAAGAGALLFALHPAQVEAVAWISDNKSLLCAAFSLAAIWVHLNETPPYSTSSAKTAAPTAEGHHFTATVLYILALLAKPTAVVVPLVVWCLDVLLWRRDAWRWTRGLIDWVLIAMVWVLITRWSQSSQQMTYITPLLARPLIAGDSLAFYMEKLLWPVRLCPDYGRTPQVVLAGTAVYWRWLIPAVVVVAVLLRPRNIASASAGVFIAGLLPVVGLLPFHFQEISTVADRYLYLPMLGAAIGVAALVHHVDRRIALPLVAAIAVMLGFLSFRQVGVWRDSDTLLSYVLRLNPQSYASHNNLAVLLRGEGKFDVAISHFRRVIELKPNIAEPHIGLGTIYLERRQFHRAEEQLRQAVALDPNSAFAERHLATALERQGKYREAVIHDRRTLELDPNQIRVARRLAWILATHPNPKVRNAAEAIRLAGSVCQRMGPHAGFRAYDVLAAAFAAAGRYEEAVAAATKAVELARQRGRLEEARQIQARLERYRNGRALNNLGNGSGNSQ